MNKSTTENFVEKVSDSGESIGVSMISIEAGSKVLIKDGKLGLLKGHRYGVCGRNGSGKTSLLKYLNELLGGVYIDQYVHNDQWQDLNIVDAILSCDTDRQRALIGLKQLEDGELSDKVVEEVSMVDLDKDEATVKKILHGLGFTNAQFAYTYYMFSGGWRTRVSLARALYMKPRILFLDEPTNHLDMEAVYWLEGYLQSFGGILMFVSHNIRFLNEVSTDIVYLTNKSVKQYTGNYYRFQNQLQNDMKKQEADWDKLQREVKALKGKGRVKEAVELEKKRALPRPEKPYRIVIDFDCREGVKSPYATMKNISFKYSEDRPFLLENLDFRLEEKTRITIVGSNGCGKSTFLKVLTNSVAPTSGELIINEKVNISYFTQHSIEQLPDDMTPVEYLQHQYPSLSAQEIRGFLGKIALEGSHHTRPIKTLSGGQRMRIVFSEVVIKRPHVLLLDEPTNHLDVETIESLIEAINNYPGSVIIISHDINLIEETQCLVYHLSDGELKLLPNGIDDYLARLGVGYGTA